jgi:hypothetical protein
MPAQARATFHAANSAVTDADPGCRLGRTLLLMVPLLGERRARDALERLPPAESAADSAEILDLFDPASRCSRTQVLGRPP